MVNSFQTFILSLIVEPHTHRNCQNWLKMADHINCRFIQLGTVAVSRSFFIGQSLGPGLAFGLGLGPMVFFPVYWICSWSISIGLGLGLSQYQLGPSWSDRLTLPLVMTGEIRRIHNLAHTK